MAKAKLCDRCGRFYIPDNKIQSPVVAVNDSRSDPTEFYDLCPVCQEDLKAFMNNAQLA